MAEHICLRCRNALSEVPAEVLVEREGVTTNISEELRSVQTTEAEVYKHVCYCSELKAIIVGSDSPAQQRHECDRFVEKT